MKRSSAGSSFWNDFFIGIKRFWMILILIIVLCSGAAYCLCGYFYLPQYSVERIVSIHGVEGESELLAETFPDTYAYSRLTQDILARMSPKIQEMPAEIELSAEGELLKIKVTSDNIYNAEAVMRLFCEIYPEYARNITGDTDISFETNGKAEVFFEGFHTLMVLLSGAGIGIVVCFILLVYYAVSRKSIRGIQSMREITSLKCIGTIPAIDMERLEQQKKNTSVLQTNPDVSKILVPYFEKMADRIIQHCEKSSDKVLLITSTTFEEGKTVTAENLALSLSEADVKVVLVQANLRPGTEYCLRGKVPGLAEYLRGECKKEEIVYEKNKNMRLVPMGNASLGNAEFIYEHFYMDELMEYLKGIADLVILDAASVVSASETSSLLCYTDSVLYVVRKEYAWKQNIREGINIVKRYKKNLLGFVLNGTDREIQEEE